MNDAELMNVLEVAVFGLAIAQALTIILTIRRERDVKDLRELVEDQRLRLVELRAWLAGRNALQTKRIASGFETSPRPTATTAKAPASGMPTQGDDQPRVTEEAVARAAKALQWEREVAGRLRAGIQADTPAQQATTAAENKRSSIADDGFKWFKEDQNEPHEIVQAREIVSSLAKENAPRIHDEPENLRLPSTPNDDLERVARAVNQLKADVEKTSVITRMNGKPPAETE
jgi:hypothetical protein